MKLTLYVMSVDVQVALLLYVTLAPHEKWTIASPNFTLASMLALDVAVRIHDKHVTILIPVQDRVPILDLAIIIPLHPALTTAIINLSLLVPILLAVVTGLTIIILIPVTMEILPDLLNLRTYLILLFLQNLLLHLTTLPLRFLNILLMN
jgi:hypothetical protein